MLDALHRSSRDILHILGHSNEDQRVPLQSSIHTFYWLWAKKMRAWPQFFHQFQEDSGSYRWFSWELLALYFLIFESKLWILHHEKWWIYWRFHTQDNRSIVDRIDGFSFCNMDIKTIFLEYKLTIIWLQFTNLIPSCCILIENPDIVDPKACIESNSEDICLCKWESKILTSYLTLREKRKMSFFGYQDVRIHEEREDLVTTLENSEFCWATSGIFIDLEFGWKDRFFVVFGETSRDDRLSSDIIDSAREIRSEEIFYDSILDRMKCNNSDISSDCKLVDRFFDRNFNMLKLSIDRNAKRLEYSFWWMIIKTRFFDNIKEIECGINRLYFSNFDNRSGYMYCFFFISISKHQITKLIFRKCHHEIASRTPLCPIKSHIEWSIISNRKTSIPIIIMCTTHPKIIEYKTNFWKIQIPKNSIDICEARMYKMFRYCWGNGIKILTGKSKIILISINPYKYITRRHMRTEHTRMTSKT